MESHPTVPTGGNARIYETFSKDVHLRRRIFDAIGERPITETLFEDIAKYHEAHKIFATANGNTNGVEEPLSKKRRLDGEAIPTRLNAKEVFEATDLSFSIPQRKKLHLKVFGDAQTGYDFGVQNPASGQLEGQVGAETFKHVLRLPVPEKAQKQYSFCLLRQVGEPFVWTVNDGPLKSFSIKDARLQKAFEGSQTVLEDVLDSVMKKYGVKITYPDEDEFASATPESHRKGEKAYHVKAFKGSKDGFLFFLPNGIFFGFKKPLHFFTFDDIESISYTSVLQRTFNLTIAYKPSPDAEPEEIEFSMLDQADFAGIDGYIKRHELADASMAEARRARRANVNKVKAEDGVEGDERTELQKAEAEIEDEEDEEDEEEEDYDPGSEGESEGSGEDSEEEEDAYGNGDEGAGNGAEARLRGEAEELDIDDEEQL